MNLQYLQDNKGNTTAVVVPIEEWNKFTEKYNDLEDLPQWQKNIIDKRLEILPNPQGGCLSKFKRNNGKPGNRLNLNTLLPLPHTRN